MPKQPAKVMTNTATTHPTFMDIEAYRQADDTRRRWGGATGRLTADTK